MPTNFRLPGPTPLPPAVLAAMQREMIPHRGPAFKSLYRDILRMAREVHRTDGDVFTWPAHRLGRLGGGDRQPPLARRSRPGRRLRRLRRPLRPRRRRLRARRAPPRRPLGPGGDAGRARAPRWTQHPDGQGRLPDPQRDLDRRHQPAARVGPAGRATTAPSSSSTRSARPAGCRWRPTPGASTSSSPARRRRGCARPGC